MAKVPAVPSRFRRTPLLFYISRHRARQLEITEIISAFKSRTTVRDVAKLLILRFHLRENPDLSPPNLIPRKSVYVSNFRYGVDGAPRKHFNLVWDIPI